MIFLIDKVKSEYQVLIYKSLYDLTTSVEWQDIYESKSLILDENGVEYEWDSSKKNEYGTIYEYTLISTFRTSVLISECLKRVNSSPNICEFTFKE
jgi:hypothetical protein